MDTSLINLFGLTGAIISGIAYLPQINHLIKEHCSAGISIKAYAMWFAASILITVNALVDGSIAFIVLGLIQILATATIFIFSKKYEGQACPSHRPGY